MMVRNSDKILDELCEVPSDAIFFIPPEIIDPVRHSKSGGKAIS